MMNRTLRRISLFVIPLLLLQLFSLECLALVPTQKDITGYSSTVEVGSQTRPNNTNIPAISRVERLADYQKEDHKKRGLFAVLFGSTLLGFSLYGISHSQQTIGSALMIITFIPLGIFSTYMGLDLLYYNNFFPNNIQNNLNKLKLLPADEQEIAAEYFLKVRAEESEKKQADGLFNLFGLLPRPETVERKEYREYLENREAP
ncbi:hypothetical protein ACFL52_04955 [Candidatus Margulisiibacteriota bacterium]